MAFPENRLGERAHAARGYFGYLWQIIKGTTVYSIYGKIASAVRKYTVLSRMIKAAVAAVSAIKTSAALIFVFGVLSALLPAAVIYAAVFFALSAASFRRIDKQVSVISGAVYIFAGGSGRISVSTAAVLSERGLIAVLTPSFVRCGFRGAKRQADGTLYVHIGYYYRMKKILEKNGIKIYFIA